MHTWLVHIISFTYICIFIFVGFTGYTAKCARQRAKDVSCVQDLFGLTQRAQVAHASVNMDIPYVMLVSTATLAAPRLHGLPKEYRTTSDVPGRSSKHFLESRVSIACGVSRTETSGCVCICASGSIHGRFCPAEQKGTSSCKKCLASNYTSVLTPLQH